jgi:hypothetical protein
VTIAFDDSPDLLKKRFNIFFGEIKTHLCDGRKVLRSKTPQLVHQEFYALMFTHAALRRLMYKAAQDSGQCKTSATAIRAA